MFLFLERDDALIEFVVTHTQTSGLRCGDKDEVKQRQRVKSQDRRVVYKKKERGERRVGERERERAPLTDATGSNSSRKSCVECVQWILLLIGLNWNRDEVNEANEAMEGEE